MLASEVVPAVLIGNISAVPFDGNIVWIANDTGRIVISGGQGIDLNAQNYKAYVDKELYAVPSDSCDHSFVLRTLAEITHSATIYTKVHFPSSTEQSRNKVISQLEARKAKQENDY